jgi:Ran GTPase-activating protein (RanGAP) involved in mRNA processing and transport
MTSLHVGMNSIPEKEMKEIITITIRKDSMKILCEVPIKDKTLTELDISGKNLGMEGALVVAEYLRDNGALLILNMSKNRMKGAEAGKALGDALAANTVLKELDLCGQPGYPNMDIAFVKAFTPGLSDNRALAKFNISKNDMCAGGCNAIFGALKGNGTLTELNIAKNKLSYGTANQVLLVGDMVEACCKGSSRHYPGKIECDSRDGTFQVKFNDGDVDRRVPRQKIKAADMSAVIALANAIPNMGVLSSVNVLSNDIPVEQAQELVKIMRSKENLTTLCGLTGVETELDFSSQGLGAGDAVLIANDISDMGGLSIANVMGNKIGKEQLSKLQEIMRSKPNLISLCGIADDATEADLSGLGMDADDADILVSELPDKRVLSVLNVASNNLGELVLPEVWTKKRERFGGKWQNQEVFTHTDGTKQIEHPGKPEGIIALANAIPDMGALLVLSLKSNGLLNKESGRALADALKGNSILTELDVSSNYEKRNTSSQDGPGFAQELAVGIRDNGALTQLDISDNELAQGEPIRDCYGSTTGYRTETAGVSNNTCDHFSWAYLHY